MPWPPDIAEQLPAPRDDEPAGLRHDIADELADHLQCAFVRELHATRDEEAAKTNVLDRFGNPASIATKLWFDAMWEKIMSQRLTLAMSLVAMLASLASAGIVCILVGQSHEATRSLLEQSRAANEALLAKLSALTASEKPPDASQPVRTFDWNPIKVKLVLDERGGPPAVGLSVSLQGNVYGEPGPTISGVYRIEKESDADGQVDFGMVRNGRYWLEVATTFRQPNAVAKQMWIPTGSSGFYRTDEYSVSEYTHRELDIRPGSDSLVEFVCPSAPLPAAPIAVEVEWPADMRDMKLWLVCDFVDVRGNRDVSGTIWTAIQNSALSPYGVSDASAQLSRGGTLIVSPAGKFVASTIDVSSLVVEGDDLVSGFDEQAAIQRLPLRPRPNLQCGHYMLLRIAAARAVNDGQRTHLQLIDKPFVFRSAAALNSGSAFIFGGGQPTGLLSASNRHVIEGDPPQFESTPDASSVWKLPVPDELAEQIRAALVMTKRS